MERVMEGEGISFPRVKYHLGKLYNTSNRIHIHNILIHVDVHKFNFPINPHVRLDSLFVCLIGALIKPMRVDLFWLNCVFS